MLGDNGLVVRVNAVPETAETAKIRMIEMMQSHATLNPLPFSHTASIEKADLESKLGNCITKAKI